MNERVIVAPSVSGSFATVPVVGTVVSGSLFDGYCTRVLVAYTPQYLDGTSWNHVTDVFTREGGRSPLWLRAGGEYGAIYPYNDELFTRIKRYSEVFYASVTLDMLVAAYNERRMAFRKAEADVLANAADALLKVFASAGVEAPDDTVQRVRTLQAMRTNGGNK